MQTKQELQTKITELENWLKDNSPEHEARPQIEKDLRDLKSKLTEKDFEDYN
jgi:molecular chaperone DnaK (HSP70)